MRDLLDKLCLYRRLSREEWRTLLAGRHSLDGVAETVAAIKARWPDCAVTLSLGEFDRDVLEAGASALVCRDTELALTLAVYGLKDGDRVLIAEGCTHHRQCEDIGTVKLPRWIRETTGVEPDYTFCSGREYPEDLTPYKLVIHCGGCTLGEREMKYRQRTAADQGIPITNYGILIASLNGILTRTIAPFPDVSGLLEDTGAAPLQGV